MIEAKIERGEKNITDIKNSRLAVYKGGKNKLRNSGSSFESFDEEYELEDNPFSVFNKMASRTLDTNEFYSAVDHYFNVRMGADVSKGPKAHKTSSNGGGGGNGMEHRIERLETKTDKIQSDLSNISQSIAVMVEAQKNVATKSDIHDIKNEILQAIQKIPSDDKIKQIISDSNKEHKIASELFVESKLNSFFNKQLVWIIGTAIASGSLAVAIIRLLLK